MIQVKPLIEGWVIESDATVGDVLDLYETDQWFFEEMSWYLPTEIGVKYISSEWRVKL